MPQDFINGADEVVIVDAPPDAATPLQAHQLSQLRQRALLLTADVVDRQLEAYLRLNGIEPSWGTQERILVCMTPRANAATLLASGRRNVDRFHGELFAVYVNQPNLTPEDQTALNRNVMLARAQQAHVDILDGKDPIGTILEYARSHGITQIFVGHNLKPDLAHAPHRRTARSPHRRSRGHRRPRLPALMAPTEPRGADGSRCFSATPPASARPIRC